MYINICVSVRVCICVCIIMKTMCPSRYHHNGFVATHALGHICTSRTQVHELPQSHCGDKRKVHCFHDYIYVMPILLL